MDVLLTFVPFTIVMIWIWLEGREEKRRLTQPDRARRNLRNLEHAIVMEMHDGEYILRQMLLDDLHQILGRYRAVAYAKEHMGVELQWPAHSSSEPTVRSTWAKWRAASAAGCASLIAACQRCVRWARGKRGGPTTPTGTAPRA